MFMYVKKRREKTIIYIFFKKFTVPCNCLITCCLITCCLITWTTKHDLVNRLTVTFTSSAAFQIGDGRTPRRRQA